MIPGEPSDEIAPPQKREVERPDGVWLVEGEIVLSEVRRDPGPTHGLFDVIAASIALLTPRRGRRTPRFGCLGFAAGGIIAPLRAMGFDHPVQAVDLDPQGVEIFRRITDFDPGEVEVEIEEAGVWLRGQRTGFDLILDDLSVPLGPGDVTKPDLSYEELPDLIARKLQPEGVAVFNLLAAPGRSWRGILEHSAAPFDEAFCLSFEEYDNRLLFAGRGLESAQGISRVLRGLLRDFGSRAPEWKLRTLR